MARAAHSARLSRPSVGVLTFSSSRAGPGAILKWHARAGPTPGSLSLFPLHGPIWQAHRPAVADSHIHPTLHAATPGSHRVLQAPRPAGHSKAQRPAESRRGGRRGPRPPPAGPWAMIGLGRGTVPPGPGRGHRRRTVLGHPRAGLRLCPPGPDSDGRALPGRALPGRRGPSANSEVPGRAGGHGAGPGGPVPDRVGGHPGSPGDSVGPAGESKKGTDRDYLY
eukprot:733746-Hanusia_phi.AAC.1